jgi:hypothetical protein
MDTVWFGVKLGVGIVIGMALLRFVWREITGLARAWQFTKRGCDYQHGGGGVRPNGWVTRDPNNDDWILWDVDRQQMLRLSDKAPKSEFKNSWFVVFA